MLVESELEAILQASKQGGSGKGGVPQCDCFLCEEQRRKDQPEEALEEDGKDGFHANSSSRKHRKGADKHSDKRSRDKEKGWKKGHKDYD